MTQMLMSVRFRSVLSVCLLGATSALSVASASDPLSLADRYPVYLKVEVDDADDSTVVKAVFIDEERGTTWTPSDDEEFMVTCGDETLPLKDSDVVTGWGAVFDGAYAIFETALPAGTVCEVSYQTEYGSSAPASTVTVPAPLDLVGPEGNVSASGDDMVFSWTPGDADDLVRVTVASSAFGSEPYVFEAASSDGTLVVPAGTLVASEEGIFVEVGAVDVEHIRTGTLDEGYAQGGEFFAAREAEVGFSLSR